MKFGVVIGVCVDFGEPQRRALDSIAQHSAPDTALVLVFNGIAPFGVSPRYEVRHEPAMIGREQGLWPLAYRLATERAWDWCATFHDDFSLLEPGWEAWIARAAATHRIGIASYVCWPYAAPAGGHAGQPDFSVVTGIGPAGTSAGSPPSGFLGVSVDGCAMAFNMALFRRRERFTPLNALCGFGEMEAGFWCLQQGWGCARIELRGDHHPNGTKNTREVLGLGAHGVNETVRAHLDVLPAIVLDADRIQVGGAAPGSRSRVISVRGPEEIRVLSPSYGEAEQEAVRRVLERAWTGSGVEVEGFEREFAAYLGVEPWQVVAVSSCTAALYLALSRALGSGAVAAGSEVIVPALTFVSPAAAARVAGARVVFADVDPDTLCLDPRSVARALTPSTRAIVAVHFAGVACDMGQLWEAARAFEAEGGAPLTVIEDCAHAVGSRVAQAQAQGSGAAALAHVGTDPRSRFACFSFNAVKNIGAGDGGAIVCHTRDDAAWFRRARWCGIDKETFTRGGGGGGGGADGDECVAWAEPTRGGSYSWRYAIPQAGLKFQMNELSAAVGRAQLRRVDAMNRRRQEIADRYARELEDLFPWLALRWPPSAAAQPMWSRHLFIADVDTENDPGCRDALIEHLRAAGIAASVHYLPLNRHEAYRNCAGETPVTWRVWPSLVTLPLHAALTDAEVARVINAVRSFRRVALCSLGPAHRDLLLRWRNENREAFFDTREVSAEAHAAWLARYFSRKWREAAQAFGALPLSWVLTRETMHLVARNGEAVGTVATVATDGTGVVEIARVMLGEKRYARQGVMREALRQLIANYLPRPSRFTLLVKPENAAAIALYRSLGFAEAAREIVSVGGTGEAGAVEAVRMDLIMSTTP